MLAGVPVFWNRGVGYSVLGQMCVTPVLNSSDTYSGGWRLNSEGRVVVGATEAAVVFNGGLPFNNVTNLGSMARQVDTVPLATDPWIRGIRVGQAGGVYMTTNLPT